MIKTVNKHPGLEILFLLLLHFHHGLAADHSFAPAVVLQADPFFAHHVFIVEKSTGLLYLFSGQESGSIQLLKTYPIATGKSPGDKLSQGDYRTPEGIYEIIDFIPKSKLLEKYGKEGEIYGIGAFVLNYPNPIDHRRSKGGGGIWLHSTNDETRIEKGQDSRGCVVIANNDLKDLSKYLELQKTPLIILQNLDYYSPPTYQKNLEEIKQFVTNWVDAWSEKNFEKYRISYHPSEFRHHSKGDIQSYMQYKKSVFQQPGRPIIKMTNLNIFVFQNYAVIYLKQEYQSAAINDTGKKTLYLKRDANFRWTIIEELWSRLTKEEINQVFVPKEKFFAVIEEG